MRDFLLLFAGVVLGMAGSLVVSEIVRFRDLMVKAVQELRELPARCAKMGSSKDAKYEAQDLFETVTQDLNAMRQRKAAKFLRSVAVDASKLVSEGFEYGVKRKVGPSTGLLEDFAQKTVPVEFFTESGIEAALRKKLPTWTEQIFGFQPDLLQVGFSTFRFLIPANNDDQRII